MRAPKILLLDGEPLLRDATARMLSRKGGIVTAVGSVDEAVDVAAEQLFDIAILDLWPGSPRASDILARLRAAGAAPRRVVVCCGSSDPEPSDAIRKPFPFDDLLRAVFGELGASSRTRPARAPRRSLRSP